jgi:hypothetical protein
VSTPPHTLTALDPAISETLADLATASPTLINASNGEYLDFEPARDGAPAHFTTAPISQLRHAFRVNRVQDTRSRHWKVEIEPVPLGEAPRRGIATAEAAPPPQFAMDLAQHSYLEFELTSQELKPSAMAKEFVPGLRAAANALARLRNEAPSEGLKLTLDTNIAEMSFASSTTGFPNYTGDDLRAFNYIAAELHVDPHSETVDSSSLTRIDRPVDLPATAWKKVMDQLHLEVHYRRLCSEYFQSFREFTQNVFISNAGLVTTIGSLMELESDTTSTVHVGISSMFNAIAGKIGSLEFTGAGVVSGAVGAALDYLLKDTGPGAGDLAVTYAKLRDELSRRFDGIITQIQRGRIEAFADWGKLEAMGKSMELNGGKNRWPADDSKLRAEAGIQMEISLWKDLLKVKWHHMTTSNGSRFLKDWSDETTRNYEEKNKNYWVETRRGKGTVGLSEVEGWYITNHWLGYGPNILVHHEPSPAMCHRLFGSKLKISRKDVFTDSSWNLTRETFAVAR